MALINPIVLLRREHPPNGGPDAQGLEVIARHELGSTRSVCPLKLMDTGISKRQKTHERAFARF